MAQYEHLPIYKKAMDMVIYLEKVVMIRKVWILFLFLFFLGAAIVDAGTVQIPKTGQTTSYATGDDGDLEKGVTWPIPRFTDQGNGTVTDNLTGLMWTKNGNLPGTYKTWQQALDHVKGMNAGTYSNFGYTDWRLPNRKELQSLIDRSRFNPALPVGHPFTNVQGYYYWSSTSDAGSSSSAWHVNMYFGIVGVSLKSYFTSPYYVWPVRSGQVGPLVHSIIGRVTENSIGLGGVTMTLSGAVSGTNTTASNGTYSFTALADGSYTITLDMIGYSFTPPDATINVAGADVTGVDFVATPTLCPHTNKFPSQALSTSSLTSMVESGPLPDFDIRLQINEIPMASSETINMAMERIKKLFGDMATVRWNRLNGTPRHLFNYSGYLTPPSYLLPEEIVRGFLKNNLDLFGLTEQELSDLITEGGYRSRHNGVTHLLLKQYYQGIPVFQGILKANMDSVGRILNIAGEYYPGIRIPLTYQLSAVDALKAASVEVAPDIVFEPEILSGPSGVDMTTVFQKGPFNKTDGFHGAGLVIFPMQDQFRLAWQVIFHKNSVERYVILVDAETGEVLYRYNMVKFNQPQGLVFEEDPDDAGQVTKPFVGDSVASPLGWLHQEVGVYSTLGGNNVCAQEDRNDQNDGGYSPSQSNGHFEYTFTNAYMNSGGTDVDTDLDAAITNLFYMINYIHDYYYGLGFDDVAGNFQRENVSGFGLGNDEVQADVQDGWDTGQRNNANFYTPPDGGKPRMQMYLFNNTRNADGDFDGDVIIHEYTHGLSTRLVGGPSNVGTLSGVQSGAMGEGWGDWFASSIYNDPVMGEYVTGDTTKGIRRYALNNSPLTYGNLCDGSCEVHNDGEIWSAALWDLRTAYISKYGYDVGKQKVEQLVVDGMINSPPYPSMLDMRDSILMSDIVDPASNGSNNNLIWQVFAQRGMGWSATTVDHNDQNPTEAFDLSNITATPNPFSPNGDSTKDTTTISVPFPKILYWTIMIKDSIANVLKTCTGTGTSASCIWDGKDSQSQIVPDGVYSYTLLIADQPAKAKMKVAYGTVTVDTTPPTGSILINNNAVWINKAAVTLTLSCTDGVGGSGCTEMQISNDGVFDSEPIEPVATSKSWALSSGDGNKKVYIRYRDAAGNVSSKYSDAIYLDTAKPVVSGVSDSPDPFKHHLGEVSTINYTVSDNLSGTCTIGVAFFNTLNTEVRRIIKNNVSCPAVGASGSFVWDGKDKNGVLVPASTYAYKIQARDKASNSSAIKQGTVVVE